MCAEIAIQVPLQGKYLCRKCCYGCFQPSHSLFATIMSVLIAGWLYMYCWKRAAQHVRIAIEHNLWGGIDRIERRKSPKILWGIGKQTAFDCRDLLPVSTNHSLMLFLEIWIFYIYDCISGNHSLFLRASHRGVSTLFNSWYDAHLRAHGGCSLFDPARALLHRLPYGEPAPLHPLEPLPPPHDSFHLR